MNIEEFRAKYNDTAYLRAFDTHLDGEEIEAIQFSLHSQDEPVYFTCWTKDYVIWSYFDYQVADRLGCKNKIDAVVVSSVERNPPEKD